MARRLSRRRVVKKALYEIIDAVLHDDDEEEEGGEEEEDIPRSPEEDEDEEEEEGMIEVEAVVCSEHSCPVCVMHMKKETLEIEGRSFSVEHIRHIENEWTRSKWGPWVIY